MNKYFSSDYTDFKAQINKELKGSKNFEEFLNLPFLGENIKRYYTQDEHKNIADFSIKLSYAAQQCKSPYFNNYLWLNSKTEALKHLSDGSYNALYSEKASDYNSIDKNIDFGFIKTMFAQGELSKEQINKFVPQGDYPSTLVLNADENTVSQEFIDCSLNNGYAFACKGASIDSELAIALNQARKQLKKNLQNPNFIVSFGADNWFGLNVKLRVLPYLWYSVLANEGESILPCKFTLKAIKSCFVNQDEYNHLLRQCMAGFTALSHGADGLILSPYIDEFLGEHASGRVASILQNECHLISNKDHYKGNYILDSGSKILADKVWAKYEELIACGDDESEAHLLEEWLEIDRKYWLNDKRKFIGLNSYLSENNSELNPAFNAEGQKTFI